MRTKLQKTYDTYSGLIKVRVVNSDEDYINIELVFNNEMVVKKLITRDSFVSLDHYMNFNYGNLTNIINN